MTPCETIIATLKERMRGDYGHDLPDDHFYCDADTIIEGLTAAGFVIFPLRSATIQKAHELPDNNVIGVSVIALVEPEHFDSLPAILAASARAVFESPDPVTPIMTDNWKVG